jgi:hypothetical protein
VHGPGHASVHGERVQNVLRLRPFIGRREREVSIEPKGAGDDIGSQKTITFAAKYEKLSLFLQLQKNLQYCAGFFLCVLIVCFSGLTRF